MAHTMDGYPVEYGDRVYDVALGIGDVVNLADNGSITVRFTDNRTAGYIDGRTRRFVHRTLYWQDPVIAAPPKSERLWLLVRAMASSASDTLKNLGYSNE